MWNVLIVEDDADMRGFFVASVRRSPSLRLVGEAGAVAEAQAWLASNQDALDVLLVDLGLPDGNGLDLIRLVRLSHPACECLVISMFGDDENVLKSIEAGALGYIHKDAAPEDISATIIEMKEGGSPISPMIARRVLSRYASSPSAEPGLPGGEVEALALTPKEQEVLELIARGFSYAEIARLQNVTIHTVQAHIKSLYGKLSVHSRSEAVFEASRMGLIQLGTGGK